MEENEMDFCRKTLKRIAWRLQYRERKRKKREVLVMPESDEFQCDPYHQVLMNMDIMEHMKSVPAVKGRYILRRLFLDGLTEREVAQELHMSQQAVSKWKTKSMRLLTQKMNSTSS